MERRYSLILRLGNTLPSDGDTDEALFLAAWRELHSHFKRPRSFSFTDEGSNKYYFTLDASDVISALEIDWNTKAGEKAYKERMKAKELLGAKPFSCDISINIKCTTNSVETLNIKRATYRFLQQLFVAMNIACPGSFSTHFSSFLENKLEIVIPDLSADLLEFSYRTAIKDKWPRVSTCSVAEAWNWLNKQRFHEVDLAEKPAIKAAFAILILGIAEGSEESAILAIARALEALFVDSKEGIQKILNQRLNLVLGVPVTNKTWLTSDPKGFYALRSAIAHGRTMIRPGVLQDNEGKTMDTIFETYIIAAERPIAVLIAILQDLVQNQSLGYDFVQRFKRI